MLDKLNVLTNRKPPIEVLKKVREPFLYNGILMSPRWKNGVLTNYFGKEENLQVSMAGDYLSISNSWQKYYKGNNYCDYTYSEVMETAYRIKDFFGLTLDEAKIKGIEYGCVIDHDPKEIYPYWMRFKNREVSPMKNKGVVYGAKFEMTDYNLKGYDKTYEVKKHDKISIGGENFRVEKEVKYMKHFYNRKRKINIRTIEDLFNPVNMQLLAQDLMENIKTIEKMQSVNLKNLSTEDIKTLAVMQSPLYRNHLKQVAQKKTWQKYQRKFKRILAENTQDSFVVEDKIRNKLIDLMNS